MIADNNLEILKRWPSDFRRYCEWTKQTKAKYGTITDFVCQERLRWTPLPSSTLETGPIFECQCQELFGAREDYKILRNDWPYGIDKDITHIVVWLKMRIPVEQQEGYLTLESRRALEDFVRVTFVQTLINNGIEAEDRVRWFKNWTGLQSIRGLEHFHVLVKDVPENIIDTWTSNP